MQTEFFSMSREIFHETIGSFPAKALYGVNTVSNKRNIKRKRYTVDSLLTGLNGTGSKPVKQNSG